ncbi:hypothetical protein KR009_004373 [Drosophila setifemur]|nr:hypothetical protein KR009_004373 [Drosophila setifemur]
MPECSLQTMGMEDPKEGFQGHFGGSKEFLIDGLTNLLQGRKCTDVEIHVGDRSFNCHLSVLQLCTEYFKQFNRIDVITLSSDVISPKGFELAYEWMIYPETKPDRKHIVEMYLTANFLGMPELLAHIWSRLDNEKLLVGGEPFRLYLQCLPFKANLLQDLVLGRIRKFFLQAVATEEYLNLEAKHVFELLQHPNMCVNSEMEMFMSAVRWLLYDWSTRQEFAVTIMQAIRFNLMPGWYTTVLKTKHADQQLQELLDLPEIQSMINLGLSFSITNSFLSPSSPLAEPLQIQKPLDRQWVFNPKVRHHHRYECSEWEYLSLEVFNVYLQQIIDAGPMYMTQLEYVNPDQLMPCCREALEASLLNK